MRRDHTEKLPPGPDKCGFASTIGRVSRLSDSLALISF